MEPCRWCERTKLSYSLLRRMLVFGIRWSIQNRFSPRTGQTVICRVLWILLFLPHSPSFALPVSRGNCRARIAIETTVIIIGGRTRLHCKKGSFRFWNMNNAASIVLESTKLLLGIASFHIAFMSIGTHRTVVVDSVVWQFFSQWVYCTILTINTLSGRIITSKNSHH